MGLNIYIKILLEIACLFHSCMCSLLYVQFWLTHGVRKLYADGWRIKINVNIRLKFLHELWDTLSSHTQTKHLITGVFTLCQTSNSLFHTRLLNRMWLVKGLCLCLALQTEQIRAISFLCKIKHFINCSIRAISFRYIPILSARKTGCGLRKHDSNLPLQESEK